MDVAALAAGFLAMQAGASQQAMATRMIKMNLDTETSVVKALLQPPAVVGESGCRCRRQRRHLGVSCIPGGTPGCPQTRSVIARISGRVQGVGYRDWTRRKAAGLGLSGWVRNLANGDVEALFSGPSGAVDNMLAACRRGPQLARVDAVTVAETDEAASGPFSVRRDR